MIQNGYPYLTSNSPFGANVENASYGGTICAERSAIVSAVSAGHRKFKTIAVVTELDEPGTPCGICRQFIVEFGLLCFRRVPGREWTQPLTNCSRGHSLQRTWISTASTRKSSDFTKLKS
ncbi:cytidine and deoxycytidylate deaminase zinc-binding region domain-containing protein [Ditylenchus destructor]|nr:cytidine and deoxycytidylate deaminase zinc-binding region domain-containing protein [Ditylenchus destructor]